MSVKSKLKKFFSISIIKTTLFNFKYWGFKGITNPRVILSKSVLVKQKEGNIEISDDTSKVWIGFGNVGFVDEKRDRFIWDVSGNIIFHGNAAFGRGSKLICMSNGTIEFGKNFSCNALSKIICNKKISFGDNCWISWDCTIMDTDFHKIFNADGIQTNLDRPILIHDNVWICSEAMILKGSVIPDGAIISAKSLVNGELSEKKAIYKDNIPIKKGVHWEK